MLQPLLPWSTAYNRILRNVDGISHTLSILVILNDASYSYYSICCKDSNCFCCGTNKELSCLLFYLIEGLSSLLLKEPQVQTLILLILQTKLSSPLLVKTVRKVGCMIKKQAIYSITIFFMSFTFFYSVQTQILKNMNNCNDQDRTLINCHQSWIILVLRRCVE